MKRRWPERKKSLYSTLCFWPWKKESSLSEKAEIIKKTENITYYISRKNQCALLLTHATACASFGLTEKPKRMNDAPFFALFAKIIHKSITTLAVIDAARCIRHGFFIVRFPIVVAAQLKLHQNCSGSNYYSNGGKNWNSLEKRDHECRLSPSYPKCAMPFLSLA